MQGEYKLEETTTHLDFWKAKYDIVMAYATPVGLWGLRLALAGLLVVAAMLITRRIQARRVARTLLSSTPRADGPVAVYLTDGAAGRERTGPRTLGMMQ